VKYGGKVGNASAKRDLDMLLLHQIDSGYNFARWAFGHPVVAEGVIEDVMVGDLRTRSGRREPNTRAWVLREVRSVALRQRGCQTTHTFADLVVPAQALSSIGARAAGIELPQSAVELLRRGVADLSLEQREMVLLRDTEGLSYREIIALTGLPQSTIVSRLRRARDALESCLPDGEKPDSRAPEWRAALSPEHEQAPAVTDAYIDAEVDISTAAAFVQHIARCRDCAQRLLTRSKLVQQIRSVTVCRAPESLRTRIQSRLSI
jgi:RNA polymerase sigma-70 factor, ECF subfamily